jgi:hypothetical protein
MVEPDEEYQIVYEVRVEGEAESEEKLEDVRAAAEGLREQVTALKEEPLELTPEDGTGEGLGEVITGILKKGKGGKTLSHAIAEGLTGGDFKKEMEEVGKDFGKRLLETTIQTALNAAVSAIPVVGPLLAGILPLQSEGLVTKPTLSLVGEHEPEFVVTQERMRALMSGGRSGYGFGPGDFGAPNVSVGSPSVNVEVTMNPGVDADIQTAYRARAGEARVSQLEG